MENLQEISASKVCTTFISKLITTQCCCVLSLNHGIVRAALLQAAKLNLYFILQLKLTCVQVLEN
jgi:hypothetical protein